MNSVLREVNEPRIVWAEGGLWFLTQLSLLSVRRLLLKFGLMNFEGWFQKSVIFWAKIFYMKSRIWNGSSQGMFALIKHIWWKIIQQNIYGLKTPESAFLHGLVEVFWFCLFLSIRNSKLILSTHWHSFWLCSLPAAHQASYFTFVLQ